MKRAQVEAIAKSAGVTITLPRGKGPTTFAGRIHAYCNGQRSDVPTMPGMTVAIDFDLVRIVECPTPDVFPCACPE